jgi:hypothetical protein
MAFPRIEIYARARQPLSGDEDLVVSQGGVLRKTSTQSIADLATSGGGGDGTTTFGGTASTLAVGTPVGIGPSGALIECKASDGMSMPSFIGFLLDPATNKVQTESLFTTSGLTAGASYFVGNSGGITTTAPTTSGYAVQRIGAAFSTTRLFLQPGLIVITDGA